jgi:hypothetical protein
VWAVQRLSLGNAPTGYTRYFFIELFDVFRPFYLAALFAQSLVRVRAAFPQGCCEVRRLTELRAGGAAQLVTAPLTTRFPHRPLFGALVCLIANAIFHPYPSVRPTELA